jgi:CheY-like chemotaxis protein/signal transduction histidine kinase
MRRTALAYLAAYFGDLVALTGAAALAVDLLSPDRVLEARAIADLSLVGAGLLAHRVAVSRLRDAPALALAVLSIGAAPSVLLAHRWWMAVAAAGAASALAPHVLPPRRTRIWLAASTLLALTALVERVDLAVVAALGVLGLGLLSQRLAWGLRRGTALNLLRREQALLAERQRSSDLLDRLARYEGRAAGQRTSTVRVALSRRLGTIGAIASSLARGLRQGVGANPPEAARRTLKQVEELARLATGGNPREQETTLALVWPLVCDAVASHILPAHHLDAVIPADLPPLSGTALEWQHILTAVVENALDAMPGGGVVKIRAGRSERPGLARITVEDTAPDAPGDLSERASGSGRAELATVAALVEALGGELQFRVAESKGAGVTIESPFHVARIGRPAKEPVKLEGTVLLADDDADARRGLAKLLQSLGLEVLEADNGTLALARLRSEPHRYRAAVLDVVMEGTPVEEIVAAVREFRPGFPVLLVSGFDTRRFVDGVIALGGVRFLRKPMERSELATAFRDLFAIEDG